MPTMTLEQVGLTNIKKNWFWYLLMGLFVGIQMIMNGWSTVMLSLAVKNIPDEEQPAEGTSPA